MDFTQYTSGRSQVSHRLSTWRYEVVSLDINCQARRLAIKGLDRLESEPTSERSNVIHRGA